MAVLGVAAGALALALTLGLSACGAARPGAQVLTDGSSPRVREVVVRVLRPPPVNLLDLGIEVLAVVPFEGPGGPEIAENLAAQLEGDGPLRALPSEEARASLMRAGVAFSWDAPSSSLLGLRKRGGVDGVVVGRVEVFEVEGWEKKSDDTVARRGTGEYGFILNEEGKIAWREKVEYARVPLYCRTDRGTVAASYRVWDAARASAVATVRRDLTMEMPSFCYRVDVSSRLKQEAQSRLLQKLFRELNARFLQEVVPLAEKATVAFELFPEGEESGLVYRNELAILYASRGEWARAREMWEECLAERPLLAAAHYNLARLDQSRARLTAAAEHLAKALALRPNPLYRQALREVRGAPPEAE
jgi:hypothetical protein